MKTMRIDKLGKSLVSEDQAKGNKLSAVILAAGKSTRMRSKASKVMHEVAGQPILEYVVQLALQIAGQSFTVVSNNDLSKNAEFIDLKEEYKFQVTLQNHPLGTADAVSCGIEGINADNFLILYGDVPMLQVSTIEKMLSKHREGSDLTVIGFELPSPNNYGKFIVENGKLTEIIEDKEASEEQKAFSLCNSGIMTISSKLLREFLKEMDSENSSAEYYLTDIVKFASSKGFEVKHIIANAEEVLGINDRVQLAQAENIMQSKLRKKMLEKGVTLIAPETVFFTSSVTIAYDVTIHPYVYFGKNVIIDSGSEIFSFSHIEGVRIGKDCTVGPFARIRPNSAIEQNCKIGNFVELKNASLNEKTKASHLSYIGDVTIGKRVNIGAGTIFCNYDGKNKHISDIEDDSSIGANSSIVSPVKIGSKVTVGAGSVITEDIPDKNLAIARSVQRNLPKKNKKNKKK